MRRYVESLRRETVVLQLSDRSSLRGVLVAVHADCLVLEHAALLAPDGAVPCDGETIVPRKSILWLQHLPAEAE